LCSGADWIANIPVVSRQYRKNLLQKLPADVVFRISSFLEDSLPFEIAAGMGLQDDAVAMISRLQRPSIRPDVRLERKVFANFRRQGVVLHDPFRPGPFRAACLKVGDLRTRVERWKAGVDPEDLLDNYLADLQSALDSAFGLFVCAIGVPRMNTSDNGKPLRFDKGVSNKSLEAALGVKDHAGTGVFLYPGLRALQMAVKADASRAWSIYMARKNFTIVDPRSLDGHTQQFIARVCNPRAPLTPEQEPKFIRMLAVVKKAAYILFGQKGKYEARAPNSGKSCSERTRKEGGKRAHLYFGSGDDYDLLTYPVTIISGGKPRTISKSSAKYQKYAYLNNFMFERLRRCSWCICGREVVDWVRDVNPRRVEGRVFVSGDLKNATDMFFGDFANTVLEVLAGTFDLTDDELTFLKANITEANLKVGEEVYKQRYGQLMGSDFSFPILCLIGFAISLESDNQSIQFLSLDTRRAKAFILEYKECGINGDDYVGWGDETKPQRWVEAVEATGGVPEPTKSPVNNSFFTVNSQLWAVDETGARPVGAVLPAMILGLNSKAHKSPAESWLYLFDSPILTVGAINLLELDVVLMPDLPRTWGGLNMIRTTSKDQVWRRRCFYARESRGVPWMDSESLEIPVKLGGRSVRTGGLTIIAADPDELDEKVMPTSEISGWVPKHEVKSLLAERFLNPKIIRWTSPNQKIPKWSELKWASRTHYFREIDWEKLAQEYDETIVNERRGLVYVNSLRHYGDEDRISTVRPATAMHFQFRRRDPFSFEQTTLVKRVRAAERRHKPVSWVGDPEFEIEEEDYAPDIMLHITNQIKEDTQVDIAAAWFRRRGSIAPFKGSISALRHVLADMREERERNKKRYKETKLDPRSEEIHIWGDSKASERSYKTSMIRGRPYFDSIAHLFELDNTPHAVKETVVTTSKVRLAHLEEEEDYTPRFRRRVPDGFESWIAKPTIPIGLATLRETQRVLGLHSE
jgi:hypothetical protein